MRVNLTSFPTLDHAFVANKRVLVRADLNLPLKDGKILDLSRLERLLPTVRELMEKKAKIILLSHFGRPQGQRVEAYSLRPIAEALSSLLGQSVLFAEDCLGEAAQATLDALQGGQVALFENLRFYPEEEANDSVFAQRLARFGDLYVNDAFSVSHRAHGSVEAITHFLPSYGGRLMCEEITALHHTLDEPTKPVLAFVAGSKVSTKLALLKTLSSRVDYLVLGGGIANTFLFARDIFMGSSLVEESMASVARDIEEHARLNDCTVVLPLDAVVAMDHEGSRFHQTLTLDNLQSGQKIFDVGPESRRLIKNLLTQVKTVVWNGPLGVFEEPPFHEGTQEIALEVARLTQAGQLFSIAGGGETVAALNMAGAGQHFSYLSTAGGAFLEWLEGKILPGVQALLNNASSVINAEKRIKAPA